MLFQPSNILPDVINGVGNGTVDLTSGLTVSWQVNGNSLMTAYTIAILQNNAASTQLYTTGKVTVSGGFSGVDYQGNVQRYTAATISAATLTSAGITNGNQYKIKITNYYMGADNTETSVEQRSLSVFYTRTAPTLTIASLTNDTLAFRENTFTATYSQAQGDSLTWVRWQLYNNTGETDTSTAYDSNLVYDSGKMYGVITLQFNYDAFLNGKVYNLVLSVQTENGIVATTSYQFIASWTVSDLENAGTINAYRLSNQTTGIRVTWDGYQYMTGTITGNVTFANGVASIGADTNVVWDNVNEEALDLATPWMFIMKTTLNNASASSLLNILDSSNNSLADIVYSYSGRSLSSTFSSAYSLSDIQGTETLTIMIIPPTTNVAYSRLLIRREGNDGALVPYDGNTPPSYISTGTVSSVAVQNNMLLFDVTSSDYIEAENAWLSVNLAHNTYNGSALIRVNSGDVYAIRNRNNSLVNVSAIDTNKTYTLIFTGSSYMLYGETNTVAGYPADTLTPNNGGVSFTKLHSVNITSTYGFTPANIAKISIDGVQKLDYMQIISGSTNLTDTIVDGLIDEIFINGTYDPTASEASGIVFNALCNGNLDAGELSIDGTAITGWAVYRESVKNNNALHLLDTSVGVSEVYDYGCPSDQGEFRYAVYPIGDSKYITSGMISRWLSPCFENWAVIEAEETDGGYYRVVHEFVFGKNFSSGNISNNNMPTVSPNFTQYATVQLSNSNYQSGTLTGLIGYIGFVSYVVQDGDTVAEIALRFGTTASQIITDNDNVSSTGELIAGSVIKVFYPDEIVSYHDDMQLRDDIWALSTTSNHLFLKSRKGDVIEIRIAGSIGMTTTDSSTTQPIAVDLPWVQVGDASRVGIVGGV